MNYELWEDGDGHSFFREGNEGMRRLLGPNAKLIWAVDASTWEEACTKQHEFLGWEPYKPMEED